MENIILSSVNLNPGAINQNIFTYNFPANVSFHNKMIALASVNMFYSWWNISEYYTNNTFSYTFPNGAGTNTYVVTIPDGNYSVADVNAYLQFIAVQNKSYLIDASGNYVYYLQLQINQPYYAVQFNSTPLPIVLPAGWTYPAGATWTVPTTTATANPQLIINNGFGKFIGFANGSYPPTPNNLGSPYSFISDATPNVNPVSSIIMVTDTSFNKYSATSSSLIAFSPTNATFGGNVFFSVPQYQWIACGNSQRSSISISFKDQFLNDLRMNDPDVTINLLIKDMI